MKLNSKFSLALIALVGIGVFALPETTALFSGQHSFYNIDATGNQIPCTKCHGDIKAELTSGLSTTTGSPGPHANFKCEYCHRAENGMASGDDAYAKITYSDATGTNKIYLVTTIYNFENGNFPKEINYQTGMTVDNWAGNIFNLTGSSFTPFSSETGTSNDTNYTGSLSTNGIANSLYNYSYASEVSTYNDTTKGLPAGPKDTNPSTQSTAFNARAVTWSGATESLFGAGSREVTPGTRYHAASIVSCLECHGGEQRKGAVGYEVNTPEPYNHANWLIDATDPKSNCSNCHYSTMPHTDTFEADLWAGGFGLTTAPNDTGSVEAHVPFVTNNDPTDPTRHGPAGTDNGGYGASNAACIACHTHVAVSINWQKGYLLNFNASEDNQGNWAIGNYNIQGTVNVTTFGNSSGSTFAAGNNTYTWQPVNGTLYINGTASNVTVVGLGQTGTSTNDSNASLVSGQ